MRRPSSLLASLGIALLIGAIGPASGLGQGSGPSPIQSAWIERGAGQSIVIRAITAGGICPKASVNGKKRRMFVHAEPTPPAFPYLTCDRLANLGAERIRVGDRRLPSPDPDPSRIVVVGDTGCRMAAPSFFQACNQLEQWPWGQVAQAIAAQRPDLIIHVGDYVYRESPCPPGNAGCAGSPYGDNWVVWNTDFFAPAGPALAAAPWVFMRGNHEDCSRQGVGWFRLLDPRPVPLACENVTPPYAIGMRKLLLMMLDSAGASDFPPFNPAPYVPQFAAFSEVNAKRKAWFLTHRPIWGLAAIQQGRSFAVTNTTLEEASGNSLPYVQAVISGHLHNFEVFSFTGGRPPQIVSGGGGTELDANITAPTLGANAAGETITSSTILTQFGFMTFTRKRRGWSSTIRGASGNVMAQCRLVGGQATC